MYRFIMKQTFDSKKITQELLDQTMGDIFNQFFDIENYLNTSDKLIKEWIVIKLVTIIEQVCRKIISAQIDTRNDIQLPESLVNLEYEKETHVSDLIASQYNFQNTNTIVNVFKTYNMSGIFNEITKDDADKLFNARHNLVHSVSKQSYDIKQLYDTTQSLLKSILDKSPYGSSYYDILHGDYFMDAEKFAESMNCYSDAIKIDPSSTIAYFCMGTIYYRENNVEMVHNCSAKIIEFEPNKSYGYFLKGLAFEKEKKYDNAIEYYNKTIKLKPDFSPAHYRKGYVLLYLGKHVEALFCGYTVMALDPKNKEIILSVITVLNETNMYDESLNLLDGYISNHSNDADAYFQKYITLHELGKIDESEQCRNKAIELNPDGDYPSIWPNNKKM